MSASTARLCCLATSIGIAFACSNDATNGKEPSNADAGRSSTGGASPNAGSIARGGIASGGSATNVGAASGATLQSGGAANVGGTSIGGAANVGGTSIGGAANVGGTVTNGGANVAGNASAGQAAAKWVGGYYVGYQRNLYPVSEIDFTALTHLFVGAGLPAADGSIDMTLYITATEGPALARDLVTRAHAAGRKAILMLGGAGADVGFRAAASDAMRATFVQRLLKLVDDYGFDGLDLDWEPILAADRIPLLRLAEALRSSRPRLILTIPVGYLNANYETVDPYYAQLAAVVDQMNLMTYAMSGAWQGWQSWHSSALDGAGSTTPTSIKSSIDRYLAAGIPAAKLGIGIGFYGICYGAPVTGPKQDLGGASCTADDNALSYAKIMADYFSTTRRQFDGSAGVPYLSSATPVGPAGCTFLSYEDEESIARKGTYVKQAGLGGTIIWTVNEGHLGTAPAGQRDPLLRAVKAAFLQ